MTGKICGTGSWAPDRVWDNNDLAKMVETSDQWIRERTGVVQRHIAKENEDTVTMAALWQPFLQQRSCPVWHVGCRSGSERKRLPALI